MKFFVPGKYLHAVHDSEIIAWLDDVTLDTTCCTLYLDLWADGYLFEAEESFQTYLAIKSGILLPCITDQEYTQLKLDRMTFLDKNRVANTMKAWSKMINS